MQVFKNALKRLKPRKLQVDTALHLEKSVFSELLGDYFWARQQGKYDKLEVILANLQGYVDEGLPEAELALQVIEEFRDYEATIKGWKGGVK